MKECQAGCKAFTGGEIRHHKDCVFYPESFSEMYDNVVEQNAQLRKQWQESVEFAATKGAEVEQLRKEWEAYHKKTLEEQWGLAEETIIRLRKEIEEYKVVVKNYDKVSGEKTETITRLTELLRRAKTRLKLIKKAPYAWHQVTDKLLTEIENAIKP